MAVATRGGEVAGVIFHGDRGAAYTVHEFSRVCRRLKITQSMGRVGSCFDNAAGESFFSSLEHEVCPGKIPLGKKRGKWLWNGRTAFIMDATTVCRIKSPIDYETATGQAA